MDQFLEASIVEELNPTWHSAVLVGWGNMTVTMEEMLESFVKVVVVKIWSCCIVNNFPNNNYVGI